MSDRELLELAAKAAGIHWQGVLRDGGVFVHEGREWNPLRNDGDAFRLSCSLRLDISFLEGFEQIIVDDYHGSSRAEEDYQPDMAAAARRAVVRAAAEIGRTMK